MSDTQRPFAAMGNGRALPLAEVPILSHGEFSRALLAALERGVRVSAFFARDPGPGPAGRGPRELVAVLADETRPFLQGARLTAWELVKDGIDTTVITDNMAGAMMRTGQVDLVVVGGTPGGIACAVRAAREGLSVLRDLGIMEDRLLPHYGADYEFSHRLVAAGYPAFLNTDIRIMSDVSNTGTSVLSCTSISAWITVWATKPVRPSSTTRPAGSTRTRWSASRRPRWRNGCRASGW